MRERNGRAGSDDEFRLLLAGSGPLLDRAGEAALARRIERGRAARSAMTGEATTNDDLAALSPAELQHVIDDGERARAQFVEANLRLVIAVARTFQGRGLGVGDLVQEGTTGLLRAVDGFDWRRGFKFSTYAVWWIRQAIQRALAEQGHALRLSSSGADDLARIQRTMGDYETDHRRPPTIDEVAALTGLEARRVRTVLEAVAPVVSLDAPTAADGGDGEPLAAIVPDDASPVEDVATRSTFRSVLTRMLDVLDERERRIMELRFGLDGRDGASSQEIARTLHLSSERVRQIEARALSKLRHPSVEPEARFLLAG